MLQPLDVVLNKPLKDGISGLCTDDNELIKYGNLERPSLSMVTTWVKEAWEDIPAEMVKKIGISNSMDGTEDNHLWQDSGESSSSEEEPEETWYTYERLTQQEWGDLLGESDDEVFAETCLSGGFAIHCGGL